MPEKKKLIKTFIRKIELDPVKKEVRVMFFPDLVHSIGVGRGTWPEMHNKIEL